MISSQTIPFSQDLISSYAWGRGSIIGLECYVFFYRFQLETCFYKGYPFVLLILKIML